MYWANCSGDTWISVAAWGCSRVQGIVLAPMTRAAINPARKIEVLLRLTIGGMSGQILLSQYTSGNGIFGILNSRLQYARDIQDFSQRTAIPDPFSHPGRYGSTLRSGQRTVDEYPC